MEDIDISKMDMFAAREYMLSVMTTTNLQGIKEYSWKMSSRPERPYRSC